MASTFRQDYNRETGQGLRKIIQHGQTALYEISKALILFTHAMLKMFLGK